MDYSSAIKRHRQPLLRIVATLFAMIGLTEDGSIDRLARPLYRKVLALLGPAEASVRRLIILLAQDIVIETRAERPAAARRAAGKKRKGPDRPNFRLFDLPKRFARRFAFRCTKVPRAEPRIHFFDADPRIPLYRQAPPPAPVPVPAVPDDTVNATRLCRRLAALKHALQDLTRQARRYARWRAKAMAQRDPQLDAKLRLRPLPKPGRKAETHEVHEILIECDWLARTALTLNTS